MEEEKLVVLLKHVCKFCKKRFGCGRSLGGHIRCHLPKPGGRRNDHQQLIRKSNATSSSSLSSETTEAENFRIISHQQLNHHQQQQQQQQRQRQLQQEVDIAMCLIRLSRDVGPWGDVSSSKNKRKRKRRRRGKVVQGTSETDVFTAVNGEKVVLDSVASQMIGGVEISENNDQSFNLCSEEELGKVDENRRRTIMSKFECNTCNKVFHSYQALGGHKASHKKQLQQQQEEFCNPLLLNRDDDNEKQVMMSSIINNNNNCSSPDSNEEEEEEVVVSTEIGIGLGSPPPKLSNKHECPICFRVFSSGQALGGHKRSHFLASSSNNDSERSSSSSSKPRPHHLLDLNFHPPPEQQDDTITTTLATSTTSNNSFVPYWWIQNNPHKLNIQLF